MAIKGLNLKFDANAWFQDVASQFQGLNPKEPGQWPLAPRIASFVATAIVVIVLGWLFLLSDVSDELDAARNDEPRLKDDFHNKLAQAVNLPELRKQKSQVEEYVTQLEKQLPGKAEMEALLSDINQAGTGRGLQFELFRPGQIVVKDYYAELPISLRIVGHYHDIGAFTADISNLSRIVTLHDLIIQVGQGRDAGNGNLSMDATARTYRYLDPDEVAAQKTAAKGAKKP